NGTYYEGVVAVHADNTVTVSGGTIVGLDTSALQLIIDNHSFFGGIVAGDFDHDGLLDLAIGDAGPSFEIVVFLSTQNGYVRAATLSQGGEMTVGDFNGDGFDDLAATTLDGVDVYLSTP
ncbi:MAG TPA: VCBS repeat-containing protein, partial [Kofleriaceae bacterium]|nr:VCBS repeat-containing protein [Kofleriaceae bacterium]